MADETKLIQKNIFKRDFRLLHYTLYKSNRNINFFKCNIPKLRINYWQSV